MQHSMLLHFRRSLAKAIISIYGENMTGLKWTIGEVEIYQIVEIEAGEIILDIFVEATPESIRKIDWLYPHFADENGCPKALVQGFLIKSDHKNILIDTCNGNQKVRTVFPKWGNLQTNYQSGELATLGAETLRHPSGNKTQTVC